MDVYMNRDKQYKDNELNIKGGIQYVISYKK